MRRRNHSEEDGKEEGNLKSPDSPAVTAQLSRSEKSVSYITHI